VDFINGRLDSEKKTPVDTKRLTAILEELFDHCLAPDTAGDGTGCDNMTAVIAKLKPGAFKEAKAASESSNDASNKRQAGDEDNDAPLVASVAKKAKTDNDNDVASCDNEQTTAAADKDEDEKSEVSASGEKEKSTQES